MISLENIDKSKHVVIVTSSDSFTDASALYTYVLRQHKKVSIVCESENIDNQFSFLPWFDKVRKVVPSSADLVLNLDLEVASLYELFRVNSVSINQKMATALYAGLLKSSNGFLNANVDGTTFALAKELIDKGAEYKQCNKFILKRVSLARLRLKAIMLQNMTLINDSKAALFSISEDDFIATGTTIDDTYASMNEALQLPYVETAILINNDANRVLKLITEEI